MLSSLWWRPKSSAFKPIVHTSKAYHETSCSDTYQALRAAEERHLSTTSVLDGSIAVRSQHFQRDDHDQVMLVLSSAKQQPESPPTIHIFPNGAPPSPVSIEPSADCVAIDDGFDLVDRLSAEDVARASAQAKQSRGIAISRLHGPLSTATKGVLGVTASVVAAAATYQFGPMLSKAMQAGCSGAVEHMKLQNPLHAGSYNPLQYVAPFARAALSSGAMNIIKHVEGSSDERDVEEIILAAEARLAAAQQATRDGRGGWSDAQISTAQQWIQEARGRYKAFVGKHAKSRTLIDLVVSAAPVTTPAIKSPTTSTATSVAATAAKAGSSSSSSSSSTPSKDASPESSSTSDEDGAPCAPTSSPATKLTPAAVVKPVGPAVTVAEMMEATRQAHQLRNPSKEQLAQEDGLEALIDALEGLSRVPFLLPTTTEEFARARIAANPAKGNRAFIENVVGRSIQMVKNFILADKDRNKKCLMLAGGAGIGKSVTLKQAMTWINMPMETFTGSEFVNVKLADGVTPYDFFCEILRKAITEFRDPETGELVPCGLLYGDDLDRAWLGSGMFAKSAACFDLFCKFCKDVGDPNLSTFNKSDPKRFSYHLAKERYFPINWTHVHFAFSCNSLPTQLKPGPTVDAATLTRLGDLGADYATAKDRLLDALQFTLPAMLGTIAKWYGETEPGFLANPPVLTKAWLARFDKLDKLPGTEDDLDLDMEDATNQKMMQELYNSLGPKTRHIDLRTSRIALIRVISADWAVVRDTFDTYLGIRGLSELVDQYQGYVSGRLQPDRSDPLATMFAGWDAKKTVTKIKAYQIQIETEMASVASAQELVQQVTTERAQLRAFPEFVRQPIDALLDQITSSESSLLRHVQKMELLVQAQKLSRLWTNRVPIVSSEVAGRRLHLTFRYFEAESSPEPKAATSDGNHLLSAGSPAPATTTTTIRQGDVNRFPPILAVFESIFWRLASLRRGQMEPNVPIFVRFTSPTAETSTLYTSLANDVFGGIPVRCANEQLTTLFESGDEFSLPDSDPSSVELRNLCENQSVQWTLNDVGDAYNCAVSKLPDKTNKSCIFYIQFNRKNYIIRRSALPVLQASFGKSTPCAMSTSDYLTIGSTELVSKAVRASIKNRLQLLDHCFSTAQQLEASACEAFVLLKLTPSVVRQIEEWSLQHRGSGAGPSDAPPMERFQIFLSNRLQAPTWELADGSFVDPRGITVFLIEDAKSPLPASAATSHVLPWLVGPPPIGGRGNRARALVATELTKINSQRKQRARLLEDLSAQQQLAPVELDSAQNDVLNQLVAYDLQEAINAREVGFELPPTPLDEAVKHFLVQLATGVNPYGLAVSFPSLAAFQSVWYEAYRPEQLRIEAAISQRIADEQAALQQARDKARAERMQADARAQAEAEVAFTHAKRNAHKAAWEQNSQQHQVIHQVRSLSPPPPPTTEQVPSA